MGSDLSIEKKFQHFLTLTNPSDVHMKCSKLRNTLKLCLKTKVLEPQESRATDGLRRQAVSVGINKLQRFDICDTEEQKPVSDKSQCILGKPSRLVLACGAGSSQINLYLTPRSS